MIMTDSNNSNCPNIDDDSVEVRLSLSILYFNLF